MRTAEKQMTAAPGSPQAMLRSFERSPQRYVRIGGVLYLAIIVLGIFGEMFVRGALVMPGDATATANNISASRFLWFSGIAGDLLMQVLDVPLIVLFYLLLRPVNEGLALFATLINLVQTAVLVANKLNLLVAVFLLDNARYLNAFSAEQRHALSYLAVRVHEYGLGVGFIFFGFACVVHGYLIFCSRFLPGTLGVLLVVAGLSYLVNSFALLLAPSLASAMFPMALVPALVGELALALWLCLKGLNMDRWRQRTLEPAQ